MDTPPETGCPAPLSLAATRAHTPASRNTELWIDPSGDSQAKSMVMGKKLGYQWRLSRASSFSAGGEDTQVEPALTAWDGDAQPIRSSRMGVHAIAEETSVGEHDSRRVGGGYVGVKMRRLKWTRRVRC